MDQLSDKDGDAMDIIEESGTVGGVSVEESRSLGEETDLHADDEDADGEVDGSDKGDDVIDPSWEDVYEQEV